MLLAGDGVGPEVVNETKRIIKWFEDNLNLSFDLDEGLVGGASYDKFGVPLKDKPLAERLFQKIIGMLNDPNLFDKIDGRFNPLADPMNSYYSLLVASPQMHHRDFGHLYEAIFDQLEEMRRLELQGEGVGV